MAALANGGTLYRPRVVDKIESSGRHRRSRVRTGEDPHDQLESSDFGTSHKAFADVVKGPGGTDAAGGQHQSKLPVRLRDGGSSWKWRGRLREERAAWLILTATMPGLFPTPRWRIRKSPSRFGRARRARRLRRRADGEKSDREIYRATEPAPEQRQARIEGNGSVQIDRRLISHFDWNSFFSPLSC